MRKIWFIPVLALSIWACAPIIHAQEKATHLQMRDVPGGGDADRLRHEIQSLRQQEKYLQRQLEETLARARQLREQIRSTHAQIVADQDKLRNMGKKPSERYRSSPRRNY